ncbi:MAG TPA: Do family serine endopeptidase [bacterium]|jgi:serine protease Do|nr:Do family serine endopeptidase [bacterium]
MRTLQRTTLLLSAALLAAAPAFAENAGGLPSFRDVARAVRPAVVNLSVVKNVQAQMDPFMNQFFGRFFDQTQPNPQSQWFKQSSLGSGVIVDAKDGYVLTNNHVVDGADAITVKLADKRELPGVVVGRDPKTDLAVVRIKDASNLTEAPFGDSDAIEVGDWVLAVGSPFGLEQTVSHGIISAKGRVIGDGPYDDFLQTDAPINPGNSGGPLVDLSGAVIGINTAISTQSGGSEGVGFAIPSNLARQIYRELVAKGKVVRGWLGVSIQDLDASLAARFGLAKDAQGVLVADVMDQGPAKDAGLESGDVILAIDGKTVEGVSELQREVAAAPVGGEVQLKVWRDARARLIKVKVGDMGRFDNDSDEGQAAADDSASTPRLGLQVRALADDEVQQNDGEAGVVVTQVDAGSPAEDAGIQAGDVIVELGRSHVASPGQLEGLVRRLKAGDGVVLRVRRNGRSLYLTLQVPEGK